MFHQAWKCSKEINMRFHILSRAIFLVGFTCVAQAATDRLPATLPAGEPNPGVVCPSDATGRTADALECKEVRGRTFWTVRSSNPTPEMRGQAQGSSVPQELVDRMRSGGLVIFMRHTHTDWTQTAIENPRQASMISDLALISNCAAQRNLVDYGRDQARQIGQNIARLRIPIEAVIASPFCRTRETAGLMDVGPTRIDYGLFDTFAMSGDPQVDTIRAALRNHLSSPVVNGNRILVGHALNITQATGDGMPSEGEMMIYEPLGQNFRLLGRIQSVQWAGLN
jgi:phosphohistidine phosphatase SixA